MQFPRARIIGLGSYLPKQILSNTDLEKIVDTSDDWIVSRTGMKERRIAHDQEFPSDMGALAAKEALEACSYSALDVEMILVATMSPDYITPSTANIIQEKVGASRAASMDIQAACSGFLYALSVAKAFIESSTYQTVLVIATEKMSAFLDYKDRNTCILFGDGAAAAVVTSKGKGLSVDALCLGSDGNFSHLSKIAAGGSRLPASYATIDAGEHYFTMTGNEIFKHAVRRMSQSAQDCLAKANLTEQDISWLIPHQANKRIIDALAKHFNISTEKVYLTIHKYANTSASSVLIALCELMNTHALKVGEHLLLTTFGVGLTWGSAILTLIDTPNE